MLHLINDILDFSKLESAKMELEVLPLDIEELFAETLDVFAYRCAEKNLELNYHIDATTPRFCQGDFQRLKQILVNLVGNAVKFTEKGEILIVAQQVWRKTPTGDTPYLHLSVRDTGIGIPADKLQDIFEAFTQADASTTRKYGGTGLGLAITRKLAALMGGEIKVTSEHGKGSDFHLEIPLKVAPEMDEVRAEERTWVDVTNGTATCLVIGHGTLYELLRNHCQTWQVVTRTLPKECTTASVTEALTPLQSVILDMGNADPARAQIVVDVAAELRKPVVLLTPLKGGRARDKVTIPTNGIHVRVSKPVKRRELLRVLAELDHHVREASSGASGFTAFGQPTPMPAAEPNPFFATASPAPFAPAAVEPQRPPTAPPAFVEHAFAPPAQPSTSPQQMPPPVPMPQEMPVQSYGQPAPYYNGMPSPQQAAAMMPYMQAAMAAGYAQGQHNVQGYPQQPPAYPMFQQPQMHPGYPQPMPMQQGYGQPMPYTPVPAAAMPMMPAIPQYGQPQGYAPQQPTSGPAPLPMMPAHQQPQTSAPPSQQPQRPAPGKGHTASAAAGENFAKNYPARILLVDDQPLNHKIVTLFLQRLGYRNVDIAHNGQEGVEMVSRGGYDIIFMDLQMPVMGGVEAAKEIRGNFLLKQQPAIIAMTGHALSGVKESCMEAGMNEFLTKPVSLDDFRRVIPLCLETAGAM